MTILFDRTQTSSGSNAKVYAAHSKRESHTRYMPNHLRCSYLYCTIIVIYLPLGGVSCSKNFFLLLSVDILIFFVPPAVCLSLSSSPICFLTNSTILIFILLSFVHQPLFPISSYLFRARISNGYRYLDSPSDVTQRS